jgi:hypothetical protein
LKTPAVWEKIYGIFFVAPENHTHVYALPKDGFKWLTSMTRFEFIQKEKECH